MIQKVYIKQIVGLLFLFSIVSCEDFLEEKSYSEFTTNKTFESIDGAQMAVNGIYEPLLSRWYWDHQFMEFTCGTDELWTEPRYNFLASNYRLTSTYEWTQGLYEQIYQGIGRANMCINRVGQMSAGTEKQRNELISEAKTLRAIYYFDAVNFFEVPPLVVEETAGYSDDIFAPNSTPKAIFNQIIEDLNYAYQNGAEPSNKGRVNKYTAAALLAKVYMFMGSEYWLPLVFDDESNPTINGENVYQLAVNMADNVISGPYSLSQAVDANEYGEIFLRSTQDGNPGVIFTINFHNPNRRTKFGEWLSPSFNGLPSDATGPVAKDPRFTDKEFWYDKELGWPRMVAHHAFTYHDDDIRFGWNVIPGRFNPNYTFRNDNCEGWQAGKYRPESAWAYGTDIAPVYIRLADVYLIKAEALNEMSPNPPPEAYEALNIVRNRVKVPAVTQAYLEVNNPHSNVDLLHGMQSGQAYFDDSDNTLYPGRHVYYTNTLIPNPTLKDKFRAAVANERYWELCFERQRWIDSKRWRRLEKIIGWENPLLKYLVACSFSDAYSNPTPKAFVKHSDNLVNPPIIINLHDGHGWYVSETGQGFVVDFNKEVHYMLPIPLSVLNANPNMKQNNSLY